MKLYEALSLEIIYHADQRAQPFQAAERDAGGGVGAGTEHGTSLLGDVGGEQVGESGAQAVLDDAAFHERVTGEDALALSHLADADATPG